MEPIVDHIQITVKDMAVAIPFYDKLMPLLGFDPEQRVEATVEAHEFHVVEYTHPRLASPSPRPERLCRRHRASAQAGRAAPPGLPRRVARRGGPAAPGARGHRRQHRAAHRSLYPEHGPDYYATFFKDPDGIKYEIVCNEPESDA